MHTDCDSDPLPKQANEYMNTGFSEYWIVEYCGELHNHWILNIGVCNWLEYWIHTFAKPVYTEWNTEYP